jgi:D-alanine-D-alanine ligase
MSTGRAVCAALERVGHSVVPIVIPGPVAGAAEPRAEAFGALEVARALRQAAVEVVFLALHGRIGEDGCIQGLCEIEGIPYTGSSLLASALAMDKVKSKELFLLYNIPTPAFYSVPATIDLADIEGIHQRFGYPVIVKPRGEGSSLALSRVSSALELVPALERVFAIDDFALVERYVKGAEITVGVLDGRAIGALEVRPRSGIYDYHSKYTRGATDYIVPAPLPAARYQNVLHLAARTVEVLGITGAARVDLIVTPDENEVVLEANTLPGMTETSLLPKIAAHAGYSFEELCDAIVQSARNHVPCRRTADASHDAGRRSGIVARGTADRVIALPLARTG